MLLRIFLFAAALSSASDVLAASLSAEELRELVTIGNFVTWRIGKVQVVPDCVDRCRKGTITAMDYKERYVPLAVAGILSISGDVKWGESGVVNVSLGAEAQRNNASSHDPNEFSIDVGTYVPKEIVQDRPVTLGIADGRLVLTKSTLNVTAFYAKVEPLLKAKERREIKLKALLEFDPFKGEWKAVALDMTGRDEDFDTMTVERELTRRGALPLR